MRRSLSSIIAVALGLLLLVGLIAVAAAGDGKFTYRPPYPESMEACEEDYHEFEPWFEIDGYSSTLGDVFPDFGYEALHFEPAKVLPGDNLINFVGEDWWLSIAWATDVVAPPFADEQAVQVSIRAEDYVDGAGPYIKHVWVLNETGQTLFFSLEAIDSKSEEVDGRCFSIDASFLCQLAKEDEPPLDGYEWDFVHQLALTATIDDVGVMTTTVNTGLDYSPNDDYAFTVTKNYFGRIKDFEATCVGDTRSAGVFQMVSLAVADGDDDVEADDDDDDKAGCGC